METNNGFKKLEYEEYQKLYEQIGSSNLQLQSEIIKAFTDNQLMFYMKTLEFFYQMVAVVGIFAGFGFTAITSVKVIPMFLLGETILISIILYALHSIRRVYKSEYDGLEKTKENYRTNVFTPRNQLLGKVVEDYIKSQGVYVEDISKLVEYDKKLFEIMSTASDNRYVDPFTKLINWLLTLSIVGLLFIVLSFFDYSWINALVLKCISS